MPFAPKLRAPVSLLCEMRRVSRLVISLVTIVAATASASCDDVRVLIVDGRNNHAWQGTTNSIRQTLLQTGIGRVDVSTAPLRYPAPFPSKPPKASDDEFATWEAEVAVWRAAEKKYDKGQETAWNQWRPDFKQYDVVVDNYNGPDWQQNVKTDLIEFVHGGGGLIVLHAANNCFGNWDEFNQMIGLGWRKKDQGTRLFFGDDGNFVRQPSGEGPDSGHGSKHPFAMTTRAANHPIMQGLPETWLHGKDELYHAMRGPADGVEVLATALSAKKQGGTGDHEPIVWTTTFGAGSVVTNTMGHYWPSGGGADARNSLHCVGFQTVLARSVQFAAKRKVDLDVPANFPGVAEPIIVHPEEMHWTVKGETLKGAPQSIKDAKERAEFKKLRNPYALLTPEESAATMQLPDGYAMEVVLAEPTIREPVLAVWDGNGRLYVAEMRSYMQDEFGKGTKTLRNGRVSRHEDTNGDGKLDRHTVFVDKLNLPRMLLPLDDRIAIVETDTTDIQSYRDTDGDGVADEKVLLYKGSRKIDASRSVEHQDSGLVWTIDNRIYLSRGRECYRFKGGKFVAEKIEFDWNQWGLDQDDTGRLFFNANSEPAKSFQQHPIYWNQIAKRAKGRWTKPKIGNDYHPGFLNMHSICSIGDRGEDHSYRSFTSATGGSVYRGDAYQDLRGDYFVCDPTGHLVRQAEVRRTDGRIELRNKYDDQKREFIASTDINFRPVATHTGPDGCLYVVDMYRGMIQDAPWVNDQMKVMLRRTGLNFNIHHGRIHRVVHPDHPPKNVPRLLDMSSSELVKQLASENGWIRDTAQKQLVIRGDIVGGESGPVIDQLAEMATSHSRPLARLHALWTLNGLESIQASNLVDAFQDTDWRVREAAVRISEPWIARDDVEVLQAIKAIVDDSDANVARQLILSLGWELTPTKIELIDHVIERHLTNEVVFLSAMTALYQQDTPMLAKIQNGSAFRKIADPKQRINTQLRWTQGIAGWKQQSAPSRSLDDEAIGLIDGGYQIYNQLCINCHGADGKGMRLPGQPAKAPSLAGSPRVLGQKEVLARIVLHGLTGPLDGKHYKEVMAPSDKNNDVWIASVLSYIRQEWGNVASIVRPNDVAKIRKASRGRYRAWTMESLQRYDLPELADRSNWLVDCNGGPDSAARAINGKSDSCDNSNQPGRWFQVDLQEDHTLTSMVLQSSTPDRFPRGYQIVVSPDGNTWSGPVATGKGEGATNQISMEPVVARFVKIVQTGRSDHHRWSLSDLRIHGVKGLVNVIKPADDEGPLPPIEVLLTMEGDPKIGETVFAKTCIQCHQVNNKGTTFGPNLSDVGKRLKKEQILASILDPNAVVEKKYQGEMVLTEEGVIRNGFVESETESLLVIRDSTGKLHEVQQDEILQRKQLTTSFMPSGLERSVSQKEFLGLVAYLLQLR